MRHFFFLYLFLGHYAFSASHSFLFFGDFGTGDTHQYQVAKGIETFCKRHTCQFLLGLGDNIYPRGTLSPSDPQFITKFEKPYQNLDFRFYMVLGNHDYRSGTVSSQILHSDHSPRWWMPAPYYHFRKGNTEFYALDTTSLLDGHGESQLQWLEQHLNKPATGWRVVFAHHPCFSYGRHGHNKTLITKLLPILQKGNVDFYLTGHDHDQQIIQHQGITHIIAGSGGKLRRTHSGELTEYAQSTYGFGHLFIEDQNARYTLLDKAGRPHYSATRTRKHFSQIATQ